MTEVIVQFFILAALEIILGIDNVIFIAILSAKLPREQQKKARQLGIGIAVISRILLLFAIKYIVDNLIDPFLFNRFSGKDLILLGGGLFLIAKSTLEIHEKLEGLEDSGHKAKPVSSFAGVLAQILLIDVIFSLDSVITAVGIVDNRWIMIAAILLSSAIMVLASGLISDFVEKHPTFKILALAFLIMIGAILVIEGWVTNASPELNHAIEALHPKNYIYFAMAFSVVLELINMRVRQSHPVKLRNNSLPSNE